MLLSFSILNIASYASFQAKQATRFQMKFTFVRLVVSKVSCILIHIGYLWILAVFNSGGIVKPYCDTIFSCQAITYSISVHLLQILCS